MKVLIDINDSSKGFRISGTYAHGKLQEDAGYDIITFTETSILDFRSSKYQDEEPKEGIFDCTYKGKPCKFYVWNRTKNLTWSGLCVYEDDIISRLYAMDCFITKEINL